MGKISAIYARHCDRKTTDASIVLLLLISVGINHILDIMDKTISKPREEIKHCGPVIGE